MKKTGTIINVEQMPADMIPKKWEENSLGGFRLQKLFNNLQGRYDRLGIIIGKSKQLNDKGKYQSDWVTDMTAVMENGEEYSFTIKHKNNRQTFIENLKEVVHNYDPDLYAGIMRDSYAYVGQRVNPISCHIKALAFGEKLNEVLDTTLEYNKLAKIEILNRQQLSEKAYMAYVKYINRGLQRGIQLTKIDRAEFKDKIFPNKKAMQKTMPKEIFEEYVKLILKEQPIKRMEVESERGFDSQFAKISPKVRKMLDEHKYVPFSNEKSGVTYNPYKAVIDYTTRFGEKFTFSFNHNNTTTSFINGFKEVARQFDSDEHVVDRCMRGGGGNMNLMTASANEIKEQFIETVRQLERYQKLAKEHKMGGNKSQQTKNRPSLKDLSTSL